MEELFELIMLSQDVQIIMDQTKTMKNLFLIS